MGNPALSRRADWLCSRIMDFGQELRAGPPQKAKPEADGAGPVSSPPWRKPQGTMPKCASDEFTLPRRLVTGAAKGGPAGTRRLDGCTKGRDARRSQTASRWAHAAGNSRSGLRNGCASGRAGCPRPFITQPVRRRAVPSWCRRDRPDPHNRRGCAACRTHDLATDRTRRFAPRRTPLWERKC